MTSRTVFLPRLTAEEAEALHGLLLDLIDGREDFTETQFEGQQPPGWRALVRILDKLEG